MSFNCNVSFLNAALNCDVVFFKHRTLLGRKLKVRIPLRFSQKNFCKWVRGGEYSVLHTAGIVRIRSMKSVRLSHIKNLTTLPVWLEG